MKLEKSPIKDDITRYKDLIKTLKSYMSYCGFNSSFARSNLKRAYAILKKKDKTNFNSEQLDKAHPGAQLTLEIM